MCWAVLVSSYKNASCRLVDFWFWQLTSGESPWHCSHSSQTYLLSLKLPLQMCSDSSPDDCLRCPIYLNYPIFLWPRHGDLQNSTLTWHSTLKSLTWHYLDWDQPTLLEPCTCLEIWTLLRRIWWLIVTYFAWAVQCGGWLIGTCSLPF